MLFLKFLVTVISWSKTAPATFGQARVLPFAMLPPFPIASQTQSTSFISIPSVFDLIEGQRRGQTNEILHKFFLPYGKPNIYLVFILSQCQ